MKGLGVSGHLISGRDFRYENFSRSMRALGYTSIICPPPISEFLPTPLTRESSHGTKELFNLPPLVLKARHLMMALPFALDYLGWKCLSRHWVGYP